MSQLEHQPKRWITRLDAAALLYFLCCSVILVSAPTYGATKKSQKSKKEPRELTGAAVKRDEHCGPDVAVAYITRVQNFDRSATTEGERIVKKCPVESGEALQWTSFLYAIGGDRDRARVIDRLWIKPPAKKAKPVERAVQLAKAGSPQFLRERLAVFDSAYTIEPKNRWTLGRALARGGDIDAARREYYTYLSARPDDEAAETEYLYLNIWAGDGRLALTKFHEAMLTHTSKDFLAAMERGVKLVYVLWPELKTRGELITPIAPVPSPAATPTPAAIAVKPLPPAKATSPVSTQAPRASSSDIQPAEGSAVLFDFENDQVPQFFALSKMTVQTDGLVLNPELYGLRSRYTALGDASIDSAGISVRTDWYLHSSLRAGGSAGWFSSPAGGFLTGRAYFLANVPSDIQLGASATRRPLALDVPLIKQDLRIARDALDAGISWREILSWRGTLEWEGTGVPHERHDGLLRWSFLGDCNSERCLDFFIPVLWERFQTLSPYYYNDDERLGFGSGVMARFEIDREFFAKAHGKLMSWQALPPAAATEHYSTTELSLELGWKNRNDQWSASYDWRRTSSERSFRKYEVPTTIRLNAGMGI